MAAALTEWANATAAGRLSGSMFTPHMIRSLGARGLIATRSAPGLRTLYSRADVERLARESVRPAAPSIAS